jgi:hypothetical protein
MLLNVLGSNSPDLLLIVLRSASFDSFETRSGAPWLPSATASLSDATKGGIRRSRSQPTRPEKPRLSLEEFSPFALVRIRPSISAELICCISPRRSKKASSSTKSFNETFIENFNFREVYPSGHSVVNAHGNLRLRQENALIHLDCFSISPFGMNFNMAHMCPVTPTTKESHT